MSFPHCDANDLSGLLWLHVTLLSLCGILIVSSFASQIADPAPYGRHADPKKAKAWGFPVPQRIAHMVSDAIPGVLLLCLVYMLYAGILPARGPFLEVRTANILLLLGWLQHYVYRGFVHPFIMPYSSRTVAVGIPLAGIFPNAIFSYLIAAQLACTKYPPHWLASPRFIIGAVLYALGTTINRWADLKLRAGRLALRRRRRAAAATAATGNAPSGAPKRGDTAGKDGAGGAGSDGSSGKSSAESSGAGGGGGGSAAAAAGMQEALLPSTRSAGNVAATTTAEGGVDGGDGAGRGGAGGGSGRRQPGQGAEAQAAARSEYFIPRGLLFELVSCPNYLGELVEWSGYALAVWSWPALAWLLFCASTFIPRSLTHHRWYKAQFGSEYPPHRRALIPYLF